MLIKSVSEAFIAFSEIIFHRRRNSEKFNRIKKYCSVFREQEETKTMKIDRNKLYALIADKGENIVGLAAQCGITPRTFYNLLNGKTQRVQFKTLYRIAELLGCSPSDLLEQEGGKSCG